jgi:5'-nucleotidase
LKISRLAFIAGESNVAYLEAFYVVLFLTSSEKDAQRVIDSKVCAAAIVKPPPTTSEHLAADDQLRFAFDADAVIFSEESEIVNQTEGLSAFHENENIKQDTSLQDSYRQV